MGLFNGVSKNRQGYDMDIKWDMIKSNIPKHLTVFNIYIYKQYVDVGL